MLTRTDPCPTPFIFIIESPSKRDFYDNTAEGPAIEEAARMMRLKTKRRNVVDLQTLLDALLECGRHTIRNEDKDELTFLHLSMHGTEEGIQLTTGDPIPWMKLQSILEPLGKHLSKKVVLCMSSCHGAHGDQMAMTFSAVPFSFIIGCSGQPTWSQTMVGYITLYHHLKMGSSLDTALNAMRVASGNEHFKCESGQQAQADFLDYCAKTPLSGYASPDATYGTSFDVSRILNPPGSEQT